MLHTDIEIDLPYEELGLVHEGRATMTLYIKDAYPDIQDEFSRPMIIICPGGGYNHHAAREGEAVALKMLEYGYNAMILKYSLFPNTYPTQLYEAAYAVNYARKHAKEWDIDTDRIIIAGFSAGGHVAGLLGTKWNSPELDYLLSTALECGHEDIKPNGMLLGYPVITSGEFAHRGSFEKILGDKYDELINEVSIEKLVSKDTPRSFIWHTFEDKSVPLENSLLLIEAMRKCNISFEYHVYPTGGHGLGLGTKETASKNNGHFEPHVSTWTELFRRWMEVMYE